MQEVRMSKWVRLMTIEGDIEKTQIESLLRSEKIQCVMVDNDNGEAMRLYLGGAHVWSDVLVTDRELVRAQELLKAFGYSLEE